MIAGAHMACKPVLMAACCQCSTHLRAMLSLTGSNPVQAQQRVAAQDEGASGAP